jgi:lycopene beta-cyclase
MDKDSSMSKSHFDYLLVGGGLQNGLLALALAHFRPEAKVALVEQSSRLGGNHTWCFHAADVPAAAAPIVDRLVVRRWSGYRVRFPLLERDLDESYAAVTSDHLHRTVCERGGSNLRVLLGEAAVKVQPHSVELASGTGLTASLVVDARGPDSFAYEEGAGFQKFVGLELSVKPGSAPALPMLMDALVTQADGFRFFYVLPLAPGRVLVEDTYFSSSPALDRVALRREIAAYSERIGLDVSSVIREEAGVLPLPTRPFPAPRWQSGLLRGGFGGGWFHPTTGYSFPLSVRLAHEVARSPLPLLPERLARLSLQVARQQRFCTLLNRLLFQGFEPDQRFHVFERFYRLPAPTVRRFYALALTPADRLRILCGAPPLGFEASRFFRRARGKVFSDETAGGNA